MPLLRSRQQQTSRDRQAAGSRGRQTVCAGNRQAADMQQTVVCMQVPAQKRHAQQAAAASGIKRQTGSR